MKKKRVASDYGEQLMQRLLFEWLTQEAQQKVRRFVKYYYTEARLEMYYAMLRYVMFGKRTRFVKAVANWHFRRWNGEESLLIAINPSCSAACFRIPGEALRAEILLSYRDAVLADGQMILPSGSYAVLSTSSF